MVTIMTSSFNINISIVHSPMDDAMGSCCDLRTRENAVETLQGVIERIIKEKIPEEDICSLIIGHKDIRKNDIKVSDAPA